MIATQNRIDLKALKQSVDLLALVRSRGHEPRRHGTGKWKINCPFHEDQEASLVITPSKNLWHCMGCDKGGSPIDFIKESDHITTGQAIRKLADKIGAVPAADLGGGPPRRAKITERESLPPHRQKLLNKVAEFYHKSLFQHEEGKAYLKERGLHDPALIETFRIGYAADFLREAIPPEGEILEDLQVLGILDAKGREHFRDCVVFPVFDTQGNVVEIYGRKTIDSAKVRHLYLKGEHRGVWNHVCARASSYLLLTESLIDAATLWQNGYKQATALYGTNGLTNDHVSLFKLHGIKRLYLVLDADDAGRRGSERTADKLKALDVECLSVELPDGHDPNSYFSNGGNVEKFDALLKTAKPICVAAKPSGQPVPQSEITEKQGAAKIEDTADGFRVSFNNRTYDVRLIDAGSGKLKATIKALTAETHRFHIDTVDLYAARSRKTFLADAAKLFHEDQAVIEVDLNRIIQQCEKRNSKPDPVREQIIQLTDKDRREAQRFGNRKDLLDRIARDIEQCGYVGERANTLAAYMTMTSRKMDDPLALLIISGSGAGKSALQDTALSFCPPEDLIKVTSLTERALFYKGEESLKHKVLALEECAGAEDASYAIRNLISQKVLVIESTVKDPMTGKLTTMENRVYGPTAVFQTTTRPDVDPETRSRFLVTTIDESREQTRRILEQQRRAKTIEGFKQKLERQHIYDRHHAFQRLLKPLPVFNPFAVMLTYPDERLLMRREQPKYLSLIDTIAFLRQRQKSVKQMNADGQAYDYIEVTLRDITLANELALEILGRTLDELSGPGRRLLLLIEKMVREWSKTEKTEPQCIEFTRRQLREHTRWSDYQIHHYLRQLVEYEYLVPVCGRNGQQYKYRLVWDGQGADGTPFVLGLKTVEELRKEANLLGFSDHLLD